MTELEKIEQAKVYIDKLANGIDPISGTLIPDGDIINNVRLSRCLFFVSDVLRRVIENGGTEPAVKKKQKKIPLEIPFEKRSQFNYSDAPISATEIARRVNSLSGDERMRGLSYSAITMWLTELGMLYSTVTPEGKQTLRPTRSGMENGISVEERTGSRGPYQAVLYNIAAQHFIVDNLDAILSSGNARAEMQGAPWTAEQDDRLIAMYKSSVPVSEIAVAMKRRASAVRNRLKKLISEETPR